MVRKIPQVRKDPRIHGVPQFEPETPWHVRVAGTFPRAPKHVPITTVPLIERFPAIAPLLGQESDYEIARRFGVCHDSVRRARGKHGIPAWKNGIWRDMQVRIPPDLPSGESKEPPRPAPAMLVPSCPPPRGTRGPRRR